MRRWPLPVKIIVGLLLTLLVLAVLTVAFLSSPYFSTAAGHWVSARSGRVVTFGGNTDFHFGRMPRVVFHEVKVGNAEWAKDPAMFEAQRVEFSFRPWKLLRGRLEIPELIAEKPKLALEKNAEGKTNWSFSQNPAAELLLIPAPEKRSDMPIIGRLQVTDGEMIYRDEPRKIDTKVTLTTVQGQTSEQDSIRVTGQGTYQDKPFALELTGASLLQMRQSEKPYPFTLKTSIGATSAEAQGTVKDPIKMEVIDITMKLKGANAADLFPITGIALPPTPAYEVQGHLTYGEQIWHFTDFKGRLGNSDLSGKVEWQPKQNQPYFKGDFVSENLDMADLAGFIGAQQKPADPTRVIPDRPLDISRLMAMNADVTFRGKHVKTPELLDNFSMNVSLKDGVLILKPVAFGLANGLITADVTMEGRKTPPATKADITFNRLSLTRLFEPLAKKYGQDNVSAGVLGGRASLTGQGKSLREILGSSNGNIGMGMEGGQLSQLLLELIGLDLFRAAGLIIKGDDNPIPVYCVAGDFAVENGLMRTREFLVDTRITTLRGEGQVNLKDEAVNFRVIVYPKKPSPLSARTPILVSGTLKNLKVGPDPVVLAARGGVATVLGTLLTPLGSWLAFIEPGLGKESRCGVFLQEIDRKTGGAIPAATPAEKAPPKTPAKKAPAAKPKK